MKSLQELTQELYDIAWRVSSLKLIEGQRDFARAIALLMTEAKLTIDDIASEVKKLDAERIEYEAECEEYFGTNYDDCPNSDADCRP